SSPSNRYGACLVYDTIRDRFVMFGGQAGLATFDQTWELTSAGWTLLAPTTTPGSAAEAAMAFDESNGVTVLARDAANPIEEILVGNRTWEFDGTTWTDRGSAPYSQGGEMVYDSARQRCLMFGGFLPADDELRTWDGSAWSIVPANNRPTARWQHSMAYDRARDRVVLYGGRGSTSTFGELWEFDGNDWTLVDAAAPPGHRYLSTLTYDEQREVCVLAGGRGVGPDINPTGTWEWNGSDWDFLPTTGPFSIEIAAAFDPDEGRITATRGAGSGTDLYHYEFQVVAPVVQDRGGACPGTAGDPTLATAPGSLPFVDDDLVLDFEVSNLPPSSPVAIFVASNSQVIDLALIGAPGCDALLTSFYRPNLGPSSPSGEIDWQFEISPAGWSLVGVEFSVQAVVVDFGANPLGVTVSNVVSFRGGTH
ncbi:MAG: hypothetical protein KDB80_14890, partial [Planctomycetes bacterium]|nr:hypothetical protein [Planctomycetota bacterium]